MPEAASHVGRATTPAAFMPAILDRLAHRYLDAIQGMTGATIVAEESEEFQEPTFSATDEMIGMLDFTGSVVGFLAVRVQEQTVADILGLGPLPPVTERAELRAEYEGFLGEALNSVSGDSLAVLVEGDHTITILAPKIIYGAVKFPRVANLTRRVSTSFGTLHFSVSIDTMQLDVNRLMRRLKASEEELISSKLELERTALELRRALEAPSEAIVIHDDGVILDVNEAFTEILGYASSEAIGQRLEDFIQPEFRGLLNDEASASSEEPFEVEGLHQDGTGVPIEIRGTAIQYQDRAARVAAVRNLSDHKQVQQALNESENHLRHALKMEAIGRLASGVAHDFRNLVSVITAQCDLLISELGEGNPLAERAEEIITAGERATELTKQLLAFGRKQVLQPTALDLGAVVSEMSAMLPRVLPANIDLDIVAPTQLGRVNADRGQIEQIIMNLVVNARDAMPDGGEIRIEIRNVMFDETYVRTHPAARLGRHIMLLVSDTGVGIDPETQAQVFEPFFTTKEEGKGTGLGLAMVYSSAKSSGGTVELESERGRGTTFKIYFPRLN